MDDLLQFVPAEKQEEFKTVAQGYIKADPETIKKNQVLFDQIVIPSLKTREENIYRDEFPKRLEEEREKIRKEYAPKDETPEQKELREMREWKAQMLEKEKSFQRKEELRVKYKDLDPDVASELYALDDDKIDKIMSSMKSKIEAAKNEKFKSGPPLGGGAGGNSLDKMNLTELMQYAKTSPEAMAEVLQFQKTRGRQ